MKNSTNYELPTTNWRDVVQQRLSIGFLRRGYSTTGGAEAYLTRLAAGLLDQGYRVVLLGTGDWPEEAWPGGEVVILPKQSLRAFAEAAIAFKKQEKIDLLFSLERVPGADIFRAGDGLHAAWLDHKSQGQKWWQRLFSKCTWRHREVLRLERELFHANAKTEVIANSAMVAQEIFNYFQFPQSQITVIPNGVPAVSQLTIQERSALRDVLGMRQEECVVLFVGSGWKRKGLCVAIKAVEHANALLEKKGAVPNLRLWVAGRGKKRHSPYIRFLGPVKKIARLYAAADLFILPTLYDPFSNASLEALAAGLPIITSSMNGCSEIITEAVHGSIVKNPLDVEKFSSALQAWRERLNNTKEAVAIRHECAQHGAQFSMERNLKATLAVIERVLAEKAE